MKKTIFAIIITILIFKTSEMSGQSYSIGVDLSFLKNAEDRGFSFKENGCQTRAARTCGQIPGNNLYSWLGTG